MGEKEKRTKRNMRDKKKRETVATETNMVADDGAKYARGSANQVEKSIKICSFGKG